MSVLSRRRPLKEIAITVSLLALAAASWFFLHRQPEDPKPAAKPVPAKLLRVVVPKPEIDGGDERLTLAASGVLTASLNTLGALEGVAAVDPLQLVGGPKTPMEMARVAAADEVVVSTIEKAGNLGRITLRRIRGSDGTVLWTDNFDASIEAQDLRLLAAAVEINLRKGFPGLRTRPGTPVLDVSDEDYASFLDLKQRIDSGRAPAQPEQLALLEGISQRAPRFLEARLLAADIALTLFQAKKEVSYRNQALASARQSQALSPGDPRPLQKRFRIEMAGGETGPAAATLKELERLLPGDPQVLVLQASLAEREGRTAEALANLRAVAERFPSWRNLNQLANFEAKAGRIEDARRHLGEILKASPGNIWAMENLAGLELIYGDLRQAERLYLDLTAKAPQSRYWNSLGVTRLFLGSFEEALAAFRQALAIDPNDIYTTLNLGDAELALGQESEAKAHYREALRRLEKDRSPGDLNSDDAMTRAQCLAHLGRTREAVAVTQKVLRQNPDDPFLLQSAALVYILVGDRASALVNAQDALEGGIQPRWFMLPPFAPLRNDPDFRRLLESKR
jgi:tetratricopeptide (TPR) repeat protein